MLARPFARAVCPLVFRRSYGQRSDVALDDNPSAKQRFWPKTPVVNPANEHLVETLKHLREEEWHSESKDQAKLRSFSNAIGCISRHPDPVRAPKDVTNLYRLFRQGKSLIISLLSAGGNQGASLPEEMLRKHVREKQDQLHVYKKYEDRFSAIPGLGSAKIAALVKQGCTTLEQLRNNPTYFNMLGNQQKKGLIWMDHLSQPVTRAQVETIVDFLRDSMLAPWEVVPVGDYRRGAQKMREASILLVHPSQVRVPIPELPIKRRLPSGAVAQIAGISWKAYRMADTKLLEDQVVGPLGMRGLLADQFKSGALDWNGASLVPTKDAHGNWGTRATRLQAIANRHGVFRWLRIQPVSAKSQGAALLFSTGDITYVRYLSTAAQQQGLLLNQFGLWRFHPLSDASAESAESTEDESAETAEKGHWELLPSATEDEIVHELGLEYVEPEKRNFKNLKG